MSVHQKKKNDMLQCYKVIIIVSVKWLILKINVSFSCK